MGGLVPTVIVGAGGHGRDLKALVEASPDHCFVGFLDDELDDPTVIGPTSQSVPAGACTLIGINAPRERERLAPSIPAASASPVIHPSAVVGPGCSFGVGCVVAAGAVLDRDVHLSDHVHVHTGVTITRTVVGPFVTLCPGATICGDVIIGQAVTVGAGAVVTNLSLVGERATIGAGAVVIEDVPAGSTVVGTPARPIRNA